jgi:hypothetical protein
MDLENKALKEAFNKKYGGSGIKTDEEDLKRFAKKYYGEQPQSVYKEPSLLEKAKRLGKAAIDVNVGRATGDTKKTTTAYRELAKGF